LQRHELRDPHALTGALTRAVAFWATEVGANAAQLPSPAARSAFLAAWHRELVANARRFGMDENGATALADSCVDGAQKIMRELLARGTPAPAGHA
jgi:hypothetical protein